MHLNMQAVDWTPCVPDCRDVHCDLHGGLRRKKKDEEEIDPEQLRKDMERLEMIKSKRCARQHPRGSQTLSIGAWCLHVCVLRMLRNCGTPRPCQGALCC